MGSNGTKVGRNEELNDNTEYFTEGTEEIVQREDVVRDLGVLMSDDVCFKSHLEEVVKDISKSKDNADEAFTRH